MKTQIQIYRAKKIDSDKYVEGFLIPPCPDHDGGIVTFEESPMCLDTGHIDVYNVVNKIDPSTISIHFHGMLASDSDRLLPNGEKDLRIFASFSGDGNGGDNLENESELETYCVIFENFEVQLFEFLDNKKIRNSVSRFSRSFVIFNKLKLIGIEK